MRLTHEPEPLRIFAEHLFSEGRGALRPHVPRFPGYPFTPHKLDTTLFRRTPYALRHTPYALRQKTNALNPTPYALRLTPPPYTLHPMPYTLHPTQ
jgi:hypothetical protein